MAAVFVCVGRSAGGEVRVEEGGGERTDTEGEVRRNKVNEDTATTRDICAMNKIRIR